MNTRRVWTLGAAASACALMTLAGSVLAQSEPPKDNVLGGPKVKDNSVPGAKSRFSTGKGDKKDRALDRGIPPGVYVKALDALRGDGVSDGVRLTKEQDDKIHAIQREFIDSERAYIQSHRAELEALRADMPPEMRARVDERLRSAKAFDKGLPKDNVKKGKKAGAPEQDEMDAPMKDKDVPSDPAAAAKARERMGQIFDEAPKPKDAQSKVWALLTDAQRPVLQAEIERLQKEGGKGAGKGKGPGGPDAGPPGELREKLKNMTPEERQKYLEEMRAKRGAKKLPDGQPKPQPRPGDVNVPKPEEPK